MDLAGKPFDQANVVFIPTASVAAGGHHGWLVEDLNRVYALGWREFNMLELNGLPRQMVLDRLRHADVIYAEGGNPYHLARSIIANELADDMADMLGTKVYVGASAGSMIFSKQLTEQTAEALGDTGDLRKLGETRARSPFFDWYLKPHLHSLQVPNRDDAWLAGLGNKVSFPIYASMTSQPSGSGTARSTSSPKGCGELLTADPPAERPLRSLRSCRSRRRRRPGRGVRARASRLRRCGRCRSRSRGSARRRRPGRPPPRRCP
jgi:dipeptidase E